MHGVKVWIRSSINIFEMLHTLELGNLTHLPSCMIFSSSCVPADRREPNGIIIFYSDHVSKYIFSCELMSLL